MSADNVPLLAFAADCHADVDMDQKAATSAADVPCSNRSISPMYRAHSSKPATLLQQLMNETDRQTDRQMDTHHNVTQTLPHTMSAESIIVIFLSLRNKAIQRELWQLSTGHTYQKSLVIASSGHKHNHRLSMTDRTLGLGDRQTIREADIRSPFYWTVCWSHLLLRFQDEQRSPPRLLQPNSRLRTKLIYLTSLNFTY